MPSRACGLWPARPALSCKTALKLKATQMQEISSSCLWQVLAWGSVEVSLPMLFSRAAVPEFDPHAVAVAKQSAALLGAAEEHLGSLLAELYAAMPSLAACGFRASFEKHVAATTVGRHVAWYGTEGTRLRDATSAAVAAVAPAMGLDMHSLQALVTRTREALAQIAH